VPLAIPYASLALAVGGLKGAQPLAIPYASLALADGGLKGAQPLILYIFFIHIYIIYE
jgi:hypothetical protein